jgi:hypothetical protein
MNIIFIYKPPRILISKENKAPKQRQASPAHSLCQKSAQTPCEPPTLRWLRPILRRK